MVKILNKGYSDKAIKMKPEFDQLSYSEKLKFMDDHFEGLTGIGNKEGEMIISIYPNLENTEEIRLFNERTIKKYESYKDDLFIEYSFERLKQRFDNEILKIRNSNPHPKNLIKDYTQGQIEKYSQRMKMEGPAKWTKKDYKGNWDLSKKVIDTSFLQARAWENYIGFLQSKIDSPEIELINSEYTVKSIIIAYYYLSKKGIYPIEELRKNPLVLKDVFLKLNEKHGFSSNSFHNDWIPLNKKDNRIKKPNDIKLAIKLLNTFKDPKIKEVIELANSELKEAELKS
ncbi:MAG TPA: hypothetical protein VIK14_03145 [Ignavibacteria bacterium]